MNKRTKSKTYLLPLVAQVLPLRQAFIPYIINTFLYREGFDKEGMYLHIQQRFNFKNPDFTRYEHELTSSEYFVESVDHGDDVIYTFLFPEEYEHEYRSFINGKYSEFKDDAKEVIIDFLNTLYRYNHKAFNFLIKVRRVLHKDERLRKQWKSKGVDIPEGSELESIISIEEETFNFQKNKSNELDKVHTVSK